MSSNPQADNSTTLGQNESLTLGSFVIRPVSGGQYRIDGGTLFGVVPRLLWERHFPPDKNNRILQETNCILIETGQKRILVDTGYGTKLTPRFCQHHDITQTDPLITNLDKKDIRPEQIDLVILSHLHFDHAGGSTCYDENQQLVATFPNAEYVVQRQEWETAMADLPELKGAYDKKDFEPLARTGQLRLVDGDQQILPGIHVRKTGGHSQGHQVIYIEQENEGAVFAGDICATKAHRSVAWCMSYDTNMLQTRREKMKLLNEIRHHNWWLLFDHDPVFWAMKEP